MYRIADLYSEIIRKPLLTDCGIACEIIDPAMAVLNRQLTERCSMYSFNLVMEGRATVIYCDREIVINKNDLFIFTPGATIYTKDVSDDYSCLCLMCDEAATYDIPLARKIITASYFPTLTHNDCKLVLDAHDASLMAHRMKEILDCQNSRHCYKDDILQSMYSIFVLDLLNIENSLQPIKDVNLHSIDIFLRFMKLINENFITHHDLKFYADNLSVSTIYLSRVIKRLSNLTVKNHIDRLLLMESCFRLSNSDIPVSTIAEDLNFANPSSFCKFFTRHKGVSPREYRNK